MRAEQLGVALAQKAERVWHLRKRADLLDHAAVMAFDLKGGQDRVVSSHWILHRDAKGCPEAVIEVDRRAVCRDVAGKVAFMRSSAERILARAREERLDASEGPEQHALQEALRRLSEDRYRLALESANLGTWEFVPDTGEIRLDERSAQISGVPSPHLTLAQALERLHPDDRARAGREVALAAEPSGGGMLDVEYRVVWPDGTVRWVAAKGRSVVEGEGAARRIVRVLGTMADITDRKRGEEELREADRRKGEFLGVLSHELRNPLTPLRAGVFVLGKNPSLDERARQATALIDRQISHLVRLVEDLLDVTRISRGKVRLQRARVDLASLIRKLLADMGEAHQRHHLVVRISNEPLWVNGDAARLRQIIENLLNNAVKFTPEGKQICVSLAASDARAVLEVADAGIGFDAETLAHLFEPYAQAERSLDRSRGGLGIGLALVKGLVDLHEGEIQAHSEGPGRGARFLVAVPLDPSAGGERRLPQAAALPPVADLRRRVLVVEDAPDVAESLREVLELAGHRVALAHDGREALAQAPKFRPDVVLCDIGLPDIDGFDVARALRRDPATASLYLIALTGYAQAEDRKRALQAGFNAHLAKPPDLFALERQLAQAPILDRSRADAAP